MILKSYILHLASPYFEKMAALRRTSVRLYIPYLPTSDLENLCVSFAHFAVQILASSIPRILEYSFPTSDFGLSVPYPNGDYQKQPAQ